LKEGFFLPIDMGVFLPIDIGGVSAN